MLTITEKAANEIQKLKPNSEQMLRISVQAGGCSGMTYKLSFDDTLSVSDKIFEENGLSIACDPKSYLYLNGTELDFTDGLEGTGFVFNNPNAKRNCGCGSSFSV